MQCSPDVRTTHGTKLIGSINREFYETYSGVFVTFQCKRSIIKVSKNRDSIECLVSFILPGDYARAYLSVQTVHL